MHFHRTLLRLPTGWIRIWLAGLMALLVASGCATRPQAPLGRYEFTAVHMAIPFRIVLYASDGATATNAADAAWKRIAALNSILSDYDPDSELSRLGTSSPHPAPVPVSPELARVIDVAHRVSAASDGAFDLSVGPLTQLWRRSRRQRQLPEADKLSAARDAVRWNAIEKDSRGVRLTRPGMRLDAGGIAKGYALDEATRVLRAHGIRSSMVAGAGDIVVTDPPPGEPGWKIEAGLLDTPDAPAPRQLLLRNASLCTSGDLFQFVEIGGTRYSHIVDPRTGLGLTNHSLVTVIGPDGITTDALSTALSVAGPDRAAAIARQFKAEFLMLRRPSGKVLQLESHGFRRHEGAVPSSLQSSSQGNEADRRP